jgi:hypothetical protein
MRERPAGRSVGEDRSSTEGVAVINRKTLIGLALTTVALFAAGAVIGEDNDFLWIVDDIVFFAFIGCALALVALSIAVLVRSVTRSRSDGV